MQVSPRPEALSSLLYPLFKSSLMFNPFLSLYYNPLANPPQPEVPRKNYFNYLHQVALLLDMVPRRAVRILIGDEVGLGKTVEAIRIMKYLLTIGEARRILIVAPSSLINQWLHHELRDLLDLSRILVLRRDTVEYIKTFVQRASDNNPLIVLASMDLVKWGSEDKHPRRKSREYYELISSIDWDLVVVDEAHHLGVAGSQLSLRTRRLTPICVRSRHLILLSATPSRGTHRDMLYRIAMLRPEIGSKIAEVIRDGSSRSRLYDILSDYVVYRRTKDQVNILESKQIFPSLATFLAVAKLGEYRYLYESLGLFLSKLFKHMDPAAKSIVKVIMLKRALSSPYAFLKTFLKVVESRTLNPITPGEPPSEEVDEHLEKALLQVIGVIPGELKIEASRLLAEFKELYERGDPGFKALAHLLYSVVMDSRDVPPELKGDYIVFSDYVATVNYLFEKLTEFFLSRGFVIDESIKTAVVEEVVKEYREQKLLGERAEERIPALFSSIRVLKLAGASGGEEKFVVLMAISHKNKDLVYLVPDIVDAVDEKLEGRVLKVLLSTDVASEGLNIQQFNIVVNYDVPWSPVRREQRIGRVYRLGQRRNCAVLDFVRETPVEYSFYTRLVLKLLNMIEQRLPLKSVEEVLELYVLREKDSREEKLLVSEKTIGLALLELLENYYGRRGDVENLLNESYKSLLEKVARHRDLVENLTTKSTQIESLRIYVEDLTGCRSQEEFAQVINETLQVLAGVVTDNPAKAIRMIYELLSSRQYRRGSGLVITILGNSGLEMGLLGLLKFRLNGTTRYSIPVLVTRENGRIGIYQGLKALKWVIDNYRAGRLLIAERASGKNRDLPGQELLGEVEKFARRLSLNFASRIQRKEEEFAQQFSMGEATSHRVEYDIETVAPIVPLVSQSIDDYEKFRHALPIDVRMWMDEAGVNHVAELYSSQACRILEVNIGKPVPYDLLVECRERGELKKLWIEVKSHLDNVLVAELSASETEFAEKHPWDYIVCNVMGLRNRDNPSSWITICGRYAELPKDIIREIKEEKRARLRFHSARQMS